MTTRRRDTARGAALYGLFLGLILLPLAAAGAQAAEPSPAPDTGNLSVVVTDGVTATPTPTPSASPSGTGQNPGSSTGGTTGSGGTRGSGSGSSTGGAGSTTGGSGSGSATPSGEVSVAGMLYVGGLNSAVALSQNPGEADVTLWFTVRNASKSTIDATANFWMNSQLFSNRVDTADAVAITALLPGETRVVTTQLRHAGQWTVLDAHVTLTPPESVDGTPLTPVTRDATVLVFPWLIVAGLAVALLGYLVFRMVRRLIFVPAIVDAA
ncbi:hypothetical protein [uncultured Microbacterium sp.]|uniref:hypothetical protein n=1 Tax=uncultured Microbacterium sp. TaxID=191216 RepID=UPI0035CBC9C6